mmetsp:Transcript_7690/g.11089  ORF Transcript_7690/g.11089 Transcript_7690/m.11089 type:complete len:89 (+) Transcript_7690:283-549(+)
MDRWGGRPNKPSRGLPPRSVFFCFLTQLPMIAQIEKAIHAGLRFRHKRQLCNVAPAPPMAAACNSNNKFQFFNFPEAKGRCLPLRSGC